MAEIAKPSGLNTRWAQGGDILDPGITKYAQGWETEIPPRQWFNFLDNRQDEAIAHINQHGVAVWDAVTEYQANKSYVQDSAGTVYRALTTNTNINPATDGGTNWQGLAWFRLASAAEAQALSSNLILLSPGRLNDAFQGSNQSLTTNGYQKLPGGAILQWGEATTATTSSIVTFPIAFTSACRFAAASDLENVAANVRYSGITTTTTTVTFTFNAAPNDFRWFAIGN